MLSKLRFKSILLLILSATIVLGGGCASSAKKKELAKLHMQMGTVYLRNGNYPEALKSLLNAERLDPDDASIHNNLGIAYLVRDKLTLAEQHLRKAVNLAPESSEARNNLGRVLIEQSRFSEAIAELTIVVNDLTYTNPEKALINLSLVYFRSGDFTNAKEYAAKALLIDRKNCVAQTLYGRAALELKEFPSACETLDKAVSLCQKLKNDEPHFYSATCYYQAKKFDEARVRFEQVTHLYKEGLHKLEAEKMLKLLR